MKPICVGIVGSGFIAELHMRPIAECSVSTSPSRRSSRAATTSWSSRSGSAFRRPFATIATSWPTAPSTSSISALARAARRNDRREHARGQARHLREAVHRVFRPFGRPRADRPACRQVGDVRTGGAGDGLDPRGDPRERTALHVRRRLVYAPAVTKTAEIVRATKDKILFMKARRAIAAPMRRMPRNGR